MIRYCGDFLALIFWNFHQRCCAEPFTAVINFTLNFHLFLFSYYYEGMFIIFSDYTIHVKTKIEDALKNMLKMNPYFTLLF